MKILVFDTETTGLPKKSRDKLTVEGLHANPQLLENWPNIIQLSYIIFDTVTNKICYEHDHVVSIPTSVAISDRSIEIHGITRKYSNNNGLPIRKVLEIFEICVLDCDIIVAHNYEFDKNMLIVESIRNNKSQMLTSMQAKIKVEYCTMIHSKELCKLPARNKMYSDPYKYPSLLELHDFLFGEKQIDTLNLHNSFIDVIVCLRCFCKMALQLDFVKTNKRFAYLFRTNCAMT
jgi:DNA polymerase III epsilon subunit-like protein